MRPRERCKRQHQQTTTVISTVGLQYYCTAGRR